MEICRVYVEKTNGDIAREIKMFNDPMELNMYVDSLNNQKQIGTINNYEIHAISEDDIKSMKTDELLKDMPFESFIKLIKHSLKEPTIKTF